MLSLLGWCVNTSGSLGYSYLKFKASRDKSSLPVTSPPPAQNGFDPDKEKTLGDLLATPPPTTGQSFPYGRVQHHTAAPLDVNTPTLTLPEGRSHRHQHQSNGTV